ncbi:hypothetical protein [Phenylobacterium sp.]|uniref:hypothetical protein n=1 Tax=Phenylobacterium sp. TaxID=1871053 RepID=UPI002DE4CED6|nr:hypothetical protein [Phenylobacterium sp.]
MVNSVSSSVLAALQAQEQALANRAADAQTTGTTSGAGPDTQTQAADPAVVYAGASAPSLSGILSVQDSLNRAASISDVGINAGQTISGLLSLVREKVAAAQGAAGPGQADTLNGDYQQLLQTIDHVAGSASFQGVKMLDGSSSADLQFQADPSGATTLGLTPQDFTTAGPVLGLANTDLLGSQDDLATLLGQVDSASSAITAQLSQMSAQSQQIQTHLGVVSQLSSALGGGATPDLNADTARLQALQIQQTLAGQSQAIANQAPQALLSLFR